MSALAGILLGLLVGLRHAFEPDHLTAVATLSTEARDLKRGALVGAVWGVGHTISLVVVGIALIAIGGVLPERLAASFELAVAGMLVVLGVRAFTRALRQGTTGDVMAHAHGGLHHEHPAEVAHIHLGSVALAWRPLAVGLLHGLAGSGALTALVFAQLPGTVERIAYIACFGVGSVVGMAVASAVAGASLGAVSRRSRRSLTLVAGVFSIVLGVIWGVPLVGLVA